MNPVNYFDLTQVINEIFGDWLLFVFVALALIYYIGTKYAVPIQAQIVLSVLFLSIIVAKTFNMAIWVFTILVTGAITYFLIAKIFNRG